MRPDGRHWRALRRDLQAREPRLLALALAIAVAAVAAVGFFVDRVEQGLEQRAAALLAADVMVESSREIPDRFAEAAHDRGLSTTRTVSFPTVVVVDDRTELVSVKAVGDGYPLRGTARIAEHPVGAGEPAARPPQTETVWLDPRLFGQLDVAVGDTVPVGDREFAVGAALTYEPDRAGELFQLAPRLMLHLDDLGTTGLITEDSRVTYALLVAGDATEVAAYRDWAEAEGGRDFQVQGVADARPEMRTTLDRATGFLGLAAMTAVLLSGAAIAIAVHAFSGREASVAVLMRCFGATQRMVVTGLVLRLLVAGVLASLVGLGVGWFAQHGLVWLIGEWFDQALPAASLRPAIVALAAGMVTLLGFGLVPALRIRRVPVIHVLRRDAGLPEPSAIAVGGAALLAVGVLLYYQAGDFELGTYMLGGAVAMLAVLGGVAWLLVRVAGRVRGRGLSPWRFGLASIARRPRTSTVQAAGFGLGLLALLLLAVVRVDLLDTWEAQIPPDAPNQFMINVQGDDVAAVRDALGTAGIDVERFYPLVRGRLVRINDREVRPDDYESERTRSLVDREFNLSLLDSVPDGNEILAGSWWPADADGSEWSIEAGIAERLDIDVGDELTFRIAGEEATGTVTNLRAVNWETFRPNFFVLASPALLEQHGADWMTAYRATGEQVQAVAGIAREFPGVTVLDVEALIEQVRSVIDQGTRAVEYVFLFSLVAGLVVLVAAVNASREERRAEIGLLRALGASRGRIRRHVVAEFGSLGAIAGALAGLGASVIGWAITQRAFDLPYAFNPWLLVIGVGGGALGIALAGLMTTRRLVDESPMGVLRST